MNKKSVIMIVVLAIMGFICLIIMSLSQKANKNEFEIKTNKETIYGLFNNFPESNNIYYTSESLYSERSIGPEIYQIDILAELTDKAYEDFINQVEFESFEKFKMKVNPNNVNYNWKKIKNIQVIQSKDVEDASIISIYVDEYTKTIYVIAMGGN